MCTCHLPHKTLGSDVHVSDVHVYMYQMYMYTYKCTCIRCTCIHTSVHVSVISIKGIGIWDSINVHNYVHVHVCYCTCMYSILITSLLLTLIRSISTKLVLGPLRLVHAVYCMTGIHVCMCTIGDYTLHVRVVCSAVLILVLTCTCSRGRARLSLMWLV